MAKTNKNKRNTNGIVFSTNPDFEFEKENQEADTLPADEQNLKVTLDRKKRKGKTVVLIENFVGTKADLEELGKQLKTHCGVGGSAKDGEIIIQGEMIDKVKTFLKDKSYGVK